MGTEVDAVIGERLNSIGVGGLLSHNRAVRGKAKLSFGDVGEKSGDVDGGENMPNDPFFVGRELLETLSEGCRWRGGYSEDFFAVKEWESEIFVFDRCNRNRDCMLW